MKNEYVLDTRHTQLEVIANVWDPKVVTTPFQFAVSLTKEASGWKAEVVADLDNLTTIGQTLIDLIPESKRAVGDTWIDREARQTELERVRRSNSNPYPLNGSKGCGELF